MKLLAASVIGFAVLAGVHEASARPFVSTRAECRQACGSVLLICRAIGVRSPQAGALCKSKIIRLCRRYGVAETCAPPTTTTTTFPGVTTTTFPSFVPTTTTLPPAAINPALAFAGTWNFYGTLSQDTCPESLPSAGTERLTVTVIPSSPGAAVGQAASAPSTTFSGGVSSTGDLALEALMSNQNGCTIDTAILLDGPISPYTTTTAGGIGFDASCPVYVAPCRVIYTGTWTR